MWQGIRKLVGAMVGSAPPTPDAEAVTLLLYPYAQPVTREEYFRAWDVIRSTDAGEKVIRQLHNNLVACYQETCPCDDEARIALWQKAHDARKKVLQDLTLHAVRGSKMITPVETKKPPQLKAGGYGAIDG